MKLDEPNLAERDDFLRKSCGKLGKPNAMNLPFEAF